MRAVRPMGRMQRSLPALSANTYDEAGVISHKAVSGQLGSYRGGEIDLSFVRVAEDYRPML